MPEGTLYLLAAEYNGQTYVLSGGDPAALANMTDANEDEWPDILSIDANGDGSPDCMEIDVDPANGVWDYLETNLYDTESDIVDWDDYYCYVEERMNLQSLADSVYSGNAYDGGLMNAIVVTPNPDGSIVLTDPYGISFEMISMVSEEDIQWQIDNEREWAEEEGRAFTEEDAQAIRMNLSHSKMMAMPNVWFQPYFCVTNRPYGEDRPMVGDQTSWLFYFYDDIKDETFETWDGELISVLPEDLKMSDGCVFINSTNDPYNWYPNYDDLDRTVRLRVLDGAIDFVGGSGRYDYDLYEWVSFESDEQICVYLYASAPADVHTHEWGEWTDNGNAETHVRICTDPECGATETRNHEWDEGVQTTPPNCTEPGVMIYTCITCGHEKEEAGADPTGHNFSDWYITQTPTCAEPGERRRECAEYGIPEIQSLDALTHDYVPTVMEPTCTGDGFTTSTCSRCGDAYTDDFTDALGHNYETVVTEPTYESIGYTTYTCTRCGNTYTDDFVDPLVHHEVLEGENSAWCTAAGGDMEVRIDEQIHCFLEVGIDGMIVAPEYYTVSEGSTIVTIHEDYLKTLAVGKHTLEVRFTTGSAETDFLVTETPFTLGDVDGNGSVTTKDALMLMQCLNGDLILTDDAFKRADLNGDGILSSVEALRILQYVNGKVNTLEM
jgi:DNA-directed RNA polymerase subunit RPC12/RpoP